VDPGEAGLDTDADLENADLDDFGDLDPDDADLQAVLAEEGLVEADLGDAGEVTGDLAGDAGVPEVPDGPGYPEDFQRGQPGRPPAWSRSPRTAVRTRRSSSSATTTIFRPRRSRWPVPPRIRSRTT
jgi:hypothetical protein